MFRFSGFGIRGLASYGGSDLFLFLLCWLRVSRRGVEDRGSSASAFWSTLNPKPFTLNPKAIPLILNPKL